MKLNKKEVQRFNPVSRNALLATFLNQWSQKKNIPQSIDGCHMKVFMLLGGCFPWGCNNIYEGLESSQRYGFVLVCSFICDIQYLNEIFL